MTKITEGRYKDQGALVLENDTVRAVILPEWGSKLASLVYKPANFETLWQAPGETYIRTKYGDCYGRGEFSGFDEMFPSLGSCFYEDPPWRGGEIPDHGEVWTIPWDWRIEDQSVHLHTRGVRFPYRLLKSVRCIEDGIRIEYCAENLSEYEFWFLWSAHPLFNAEEGSRIVVPAGMNKAVNYCAEKILKEFGKAYDWPEVRTEDGGVFDLSRMPGRNETAYHKYWFDGPVREGRAALEHPKRKLKIELLWPKETVPYLAVWMNEGGLCGQYNLALEPATGTMERLDLARLWGGCSRIAAGGRYAWHLEIRIRPLP